MQETDQERRKTYDSKTAWYDP